PVGPPPTNKWVCAAAAETQAIDARAVRAAKVVRVRRRIGFMVTSPHRTQSRPIESPPEPCRSPAAKARDRSKQNRRPRRTGGFEDSSNSEGEAEAHRAFGSARQPLGFHLAFGGRGVAPVLADVAD